MHIPFQLRSFTSSCPLVGLLPLQSFLAFLRFSDRIRSEPFTDEIERCSGFCPPIPSRSRRALCDPREEMPRNLFLGWGRIGEEGEKGTSVTKRPGTTKLQWNLYIRNLSRFVPTACGRCVNVARCGAYDKRTALVSLYFCTTRIWQVQNPRFYNSQPLPRELRDRNERHKLVRLAQ